MEFSCGGILNVKVDGIQKPITHLFLVESFCNMTYATLFLKNIIYKSLHSQREFTISQNLALQGVLEVHGIDRPRWGENARAMSSFPNYSMPDCCARLLSTSVRTSHKSQYTLFVGISNDDPRAAHNRAEKNEPYHQRRAQ